MKAIVDKETCIGCGLCPSIAPDVFEMGDDGKAHVITSTVPAGSEDAAKESEASCPVNAIKVQ
ncbi:ferredoxin [Thermobrachium celere]|uniref:Ferredoxin n=1 Tax=Thermobrachium celere DSM 8682 TaxID=941824 RepID=R7RME6_9CLOT|nr:ferredoxin [Thermobrachium celere]GFR34444.1 ferredoxin [Thermobrachium celere]CDF57209.1 Ferredoxin [Thermobrachium celere DSM 8682]